MTTAIAGASGIEPVRGWAPDWYSWAQFGAAAGRIPLGGNASLAATEQPIHRKATATEKMPMDVLLLKHNGELS